MPMRTMRMRAGEWNVGSTGAASALLALACMMTSSSAAAQGFTGGSGLDNSTTQAAAAPAGNGGMATDSDSVPAAPASPAPAAASTGVAAPGPGSPPPPGGPATATPKRNSGSPSGYSYGDKTDATAILAGAPRSSRGGAQKATGGGRRTKSAGSGAAIATYPGFAMRDDGGSEVFVQLTKPVDVEEHKAAGVVTYILKGAHVIHRNNENALVTVHFNTPVSRAKLKDVRGGLALEIDLRGDAAPTYKVEPAEGASRLVVDFPQGQFLDSNGEPLAMASAAGTGQTTAKTSRAKRRSRRAAAADAPPPSHDPMQ